MKRKHLIIIIGQSIIIVLLTVYAFVQQTAAKAAQREAESQMERALKAEEEAEKQSILAEAAAEEAKRQNDLASEFQKQLDKKK